LFEILPKKITDQRDTDKEERYFLEKPLLRIFDIKKKEKLRPKEALTCFLGFLFVKKNQCRV